MAKKPKTINLYLVLEDPVHAANIKKENNHWDFDINYQTATDRDGEPDGVEKLKRDIALSLEDVIEEGGESIPMGTPNWRKDPGLPPNLYCMNNATDTAIGWMTGAFCQYHATDELANLVVNDEGQADKFFNWFEDNVQDLLQQYQSTGFTFLNMDGELELAILPEGITMTPPKAITYPKDCPKGTICPEEKPGEFWRKIKSDVTVPKSSLDD